MYFMEGARIGFFQGDVKKLVGDIKELKPTVFVSVPRLLNRMYDKVSVVTLRECGQRFTPPPTCGVRRLLVCLVHL